MKTYLTVLALLLLLPRCGSSPVEVTGGTSSNLTDADLSSTAIVDLSSRTHIEVSPSSPTAGQVFTIQGDNCSTESDVKVCLTGQLCIAVSVQPDQTFTISDSLYYSGTYQLNAYQSRHGNLYRIYSGTVVVTN